MQRRGIVADTPPYFHESCTAVGMTYIVTLHVLFAVSPPLLLFVVYKALLLPTGYTERWVYKILSRRGRKQTAVFDPS
jgi:hypothetical protein